MISGLHTIWCPVRDMDRAVAFYRDVLGLTPGFTSTHWSEFSLSNGKIALHLWDEFPDTPGPGWVLGTVVDDLNALAKKLTAADVKADEFHETPNGVVIAFSDPDGNQINAIQLGTKLTDVTG